MNIIDRFWLKVNKHGPNGCWEWAGKIKQGHGYGILTLADPTLGLKPDGKTRQRDIRAHRFSWEIHNGPISQDVVVCHKCDNRRCVNPNHLFIGTQADNMQDMIKKGRQAKGPKVANFGDKNGFFRRTHSKESKEKMCNAWKIRKLISN